MSDGTSPSTGGTSNGIEFVLIPAAELAVLKSTKAAEFTLSDAEALLENRDVFIRLIDKVKLNLQIDKWLGKARWREEEVDFKILWLEELKAFTFEMEKMVKKFRDEEEEKKTKAIKIAKDAVKQ